MVDAEQPAWKSWIIQADRDLEAARLVVVTHPEVATFQAEQAAEKAVKGLYMVKMGRMAPRTHRVGNLLSELGAPAHLVAAGEDLGEAYMATRYPDAASGRAPGEVIAVESAQESIQQTESVVAWVKSELPAE